MTVLDLSAARIADLVRGGELARREVVEAHAARIEERNGELNALVDLRLDEALVEADGRGRGGPLDGVPVSVKHNFDVGGLPTTMGIRSRAGLIADRDEPAVRRLRDAGAIVLGSDYGGSIRVPASWCGVLGFRPTTGLVPRAPVLPPHDFAPSYDLMASSALVARSARDLELAFDVLRGASVHDPASVPVEPPPAAEPGRIALLLRETGVVIDPEVEQAVRSAADSLRDAGYEVEEEAAPDLRRAPELWAEIIGTELVRQRLPALRDQIGASGLQHAEALFGQFELGSEVERYLDALLERRALARAVAAWMEDHPLVLAPVAGMPAPPLDFDEGLSLEETRALFDRMRGQLWVNLFGLPAVALGDGAQIVARRFHDRDVLRAARAIEPGGES